ncbi:nuclear transport factor 2 family protein [Nocardioides nanhaiensis]|uniref:SnoaL-like domain-containing protein n=1 Tax=Nocardioides nanhaiensis TaxID=1476871 RepID=A0ABP8VVV2_9ACTN
MVNLQLAAEVHQLLAAYGHAIDRCDAVGWAHLFHEDGVSTGPGRPDLRGRAELETWVRDHPRRDLLHTCTNIEVVGERDGVIDVRSHFVIHQRDETGYRVAVVGSYADQLVRTDGRLRFWRRHATAR